MFWHNKKKESDNLPSNIKGFDLYINEERQAILNIIRLNLSKYKTDKEILQAALIIGLQIMEETATHQAIYLKKVDGILHEFKIQ
jgi:hypothetical protein